MYKRQLILLIICIGLFTGATSCKEYPYETNPIETMVPLEYSEEAMNDGSYLQAIDALERGGFNPIAVDYPTFDHLMFLYITDYQGSGGPTHSLLIDVKASKAIYCKHLDLISENAPEAYTFVDLDSSDIETIIGFGSVQGVTSWDNSYKSSYGDCYWGITIYFDDGRFYHSGGSYYPDVYKELEKDIWPLIGKKADDTFRWMGSVSY